MVVTSAQWPWAWTPRCRRSSPGDRSETAHGRCSSPAVSDGLENLIVPVYVIVRRLDLDRGCGR